MRLQFDKIGQCVYCGDNLTNGHKCLDFNKIIMKKCKDILETHTYNNELNVLKQMVLHLIGENEKLQKKLKKVGK